MRDYQAAAETLRRDAAEAGLIRDQATDETKRDLFDRLCQHLNILADAVERASPLYPRAGDMAKPMAGAVSDMPSGSTAE